MHRLLISLVTIFILGSASAQVLPPLGPEYLQRDRLQLSGDSLRFCVVNDNMLADYHRDLATELAATQLLSAEIINVDPPRPSEPLDYRLQLTEPQLYYLLANECEVFMGMALSSSLNRWEWLLVSQPYHLSRSVFVTTDPDLQQWTDLPLDEQIGTRIQTSADIQLVTYLNTLPESERWRRVPYYNNLIALEQLLAGQTAVSLLWEPAVVRFEADNPDAPQLHRLPASPLSIITLGLGLGFRSQDTFIQTALDTGLRELEELGILSELAEKHSLPGLPLD